MKKILFAWSFPIDVTHGGVERVTSVIMDSLTKRGYVCHNIICKKDNTVFYTNNTIDVDNVIFADDLNQYLAGQKYDYIICQDGCSKSMTKMFKENCPYTTKVLCFLHFAPSHWETLYSPNAILSEIRLEQNIKIRFQWVIRLLSYPLWYRRAINEIIDIYKTNYYYCDRFILLSKCFVPEMEYYLRKNIDNKIRWIQNPLSFDKKNLSDKFLRTKKKIVLIVSRFDERQKNLIFALDVWKTIQDKGYSNWVLKIVGYGPAEQYYKNKVVKEGVKNVFFEGQQNSKSYFEEASLFMMTSATEGWGMTLTESQQMGVVPIVRDTYSSLHEIVFDNVNGYIIDKNDKNKFAEKAIRLMNDENLRIQFAKSGFKSCSRFSIDKITDKWAALLNE